MNTHVINTYKYILILISRIFLLLFLLMPIITIITESIQLGFKYYLDVIFDTEAIEAFILTLKVVLVVVPLNLIFGFAASWCITKFDFACKNVILILIDLPFSVSPVISGFAYLAVFGLDTMLGAMLAHNNIHVVFAFPAIVFVTMFVTLPLIARELIPLMQQQTNEQEEAALMLGASNWQVIYHITLPRIKWALIYGTSLCTARAIGEFGAVSVVSGYIRGETTTISLYVEALYNEYNAIAAFAVSSVLIAIAIMTLLIKHYIGVKK